MATSDTPGGPPPPPVSDAPVVARYKLENYAPAKDVMPDEGEVTVYENRTKITDLSGLSFSPSYVGVFRLSLYDDATRKPIKEIDAAVASKLRAKIAEALDPKNTTQGPELSESSRPFPMTELLKKLDERLKDPNDRLPAHITDTGVWGSVLSGADEFSRRQGATLGLYASKTEFGIIRNLYLAVQSGAGPQPVAAFREWVQSRAESGLTYGELARSQHYKELLHLAKRNAQRLVFELLVECGLANAVEHYSDPHAIANEDETEVPSKLIKDKSLVASVMSDVLVPFNDDTVAFYSRAVPYSLVTKTLVSVLHPAQGLAVFALKECATATSADEDDGEVFTATGTSMGYPLTPPREEAPKYDRESLQQAYVDTGAGLETFVESRNFAGRTARALPTPQGSCQGEWRFLSPVIVIAD